MLAKLTRSGAEYTNAATSNPSDSDPCGTALMTGGNPKSTGIYCDVEYSHNTDEPGAACTPGQPVTGGDMIYDSPDDALADVSDFIDPANGTFPSFDEDGSIYPNGVDTSPAAIMNLRTDASSFNTATFPVDPVTYRNTPCTCRSTARGRASMTTSGRKSTRRPSCRTASRTRRTTTRGGLGQRTTIPEQRVDNKHGKTRQTCRLGLPPPWPESRPTLILPTNQVGAVDSRQMFRRLPLRT